MATPVGMGDKALTILGHVLHRAQGLLGPYFLGPSDDLPGSILGPFQDLRATFGHLLVTPAWPIQAFPGTFRGPFRNGQKTKNGPEMGQIPSVWDDIGCK